MTTDLSPSRLLEPAHRIHHRVVLQSKVAVSDSGCQELKSVQDSRQLKNIDDDQRDVVLLAYCRGLPLTESEKQLLHQLESWL